MHQPGTSTLLRHPAAFWLLRLFFAAVWLINGLYHKLLDGVPRHREIVARILGEDHATVFTQAIGLGEVCFALWIVSAWWWRLSCALQVVLVLTMNVLELLLAPDLLLFGAVNGLVALGYISLVAWAGWFYGSPAKGSTRPLSTEPQP
ncbi:MAG: hypothetical protein EA402_09570 [Planctomycetota bacterium]|nr:MAG: hypothetical protein EA402_09570 [Planctomycetota bacterium]